MIDEKQFSPILESQGFRNIAQAIRRSTVTPLYLGRNSLYEVRFGLGQDLTRKSQYKEDFIQALGDFMHTYNDETMRVYRRTKQSFRALITVHDIEEIIHLIDQYGPKGAKIVCSLLVAYGYARDPREASDSAASGSEPANRSGDADTDADSMADALSV